MQYKVGDEVLVKGSITRVLDNGIVFSCFCGEAFIHRENFDTEIPLEKTYSQGLADAWELAKKLLLSKDKGGLTTNELADIFYTTYPTDVFEKYTYEEALAKIEAYEMEKEIKVGDVVEDEEGTKALVIDEATENTCFVFTENGCVEDWYKVDLKKTGKKISIESLLKEIGE